MVGVVPSAAKQVCRTLPEVQAVAVPHLQVAEEQMLLNVASHLAADPHLHVPASQVSESPVQDIKSHGAREFYNEKYSNNIQILKINITKLFPDFSDFSLLSHIPFVVVSVGLGGADVGVD